MACNESMKREDDASLAKAMAMKRAIELAIEGFFKIMIFETNKKNPGKGY